MAKKFFILLLFISSTAFSKTETPRTLVHVLDYLASDYGGSISNGKVSNASEHKEHQELISTAVDLASKDIEMKKHPDTQAELLELQTLISQLAPAEKIGALSQKIKNQIISFTHLEVAPREWPNLQAGRKVFEMQCASCHGLQGRGDGPAAKALKPSPANFQDEKVMADLSPFKIFNAARVGIQGTAMAGFTTISDKDLWAVSFYVASLRHSWVDTKNGDISEINLDQAATLTDEEISKINPGPEDKRKLFVAAVRNHTNTDDPNGRLSEATNLLNESLQDYKNGNVDFAKNKALSAYLNGIEPIEPRIKARNPQMLIDIEKAMGDVRSAMSAKQSLDDVEKEIVKTQTLIQKIGTLIGESVSSPSFTFFMAASILLREGAEAVLVIIALLGVLRATNAKKAVRWVHGGWVAAVIFGFVLWFFSGWLLQLSGAGRELMEGSVSLFAVIILLYMGFWLHSKTEIGRWNGFIKEKVNSALGSGSLIGLSFIAFTAVAREAVETVLFLRTIWIESGSQEGMKSAMIGGVAFAFVAVILLSWLLLKYSSKVPIRKVFAYSSSIMALLAFILIGKALHSIQEAGKLPITSLPLNFRSDLLGLYPTAETIFSQILILGIVLFLWNIGKKPSAPLLTNR